MPRSDDSQQSLTATPAVEPAALDDCKCSDFQRDMVCDHVLMAAAVRMVRRMIDAHGETEKPH